MVKIQCVTGKVMEFKDLNSEQRRQLVDTRQQFEVLTATKRELAKRYRGSMRWKEVRGKEYLVRSNGLGGDVGLGARSAKTEETRNAFVSGKHALKDRLNTIKGQLNHLAKVNKATLLGRVPLLVARVCRRLDDTGLLGRNVLIVGTNAIYGYEALAGVFFSGEALAASDLDILWDSRSRLRLAVSDYSREGILGMLQRVDKSFSRQEGKEYRAINREGYMVDLIRPESDPPWKPSDPPWKPTDPERIGGADDLTAAPIRGLEWLISSPRLESIAIDGSGYPVRMVVPDPRAFALHKAWLCEQPNRDPVKKFRDLEQAKLVAKLVRERLPQYAFTDDDLRAFPADLRSAV